MKHLKTAAALLGLITMSAATFLQPTDQQTLLGRSPDDIIEMFGVPDNASLSANVLKFFYTDKNKKRIEFAFHEGVAITAPAAGFQPGKIQRPVVGQAYTGQSARSAALQLGSVTRMTVGSTTANVVYADGTEAQLAHGRIFPH